MIQHNIKEGLSINLEKTVTAADTAGTSGSEALNYLLATPAIVNLLFTTSVKMLDKLLPAGYVTVAKSISLNHLHPTPVGDKISLVITVNKVQDSSIMMDFVVSDPTGVVCQGSYERKIVNAHKLLEIAHIQGDKTI